MADNKNIRKISTVAGFLQWAKKNRGNDERSMLYRGLADEDWEVEAGSYRRLRKSIPSKNPQENLLQVLFAEANKRLLQKVRMEKYCKEGSDLELLAKLQHDGAATCLIDFTTQPLIALWFACQSSSDKDRSGKVVATSRQQYSSVTPEDMKEKEIWNFLWPENKKPKLWIWEPPGQNNNRIIAQHSVFVFGPPKISIDKNDSCIIKEKNKEKILKELRNMGISAESLFRDYAGFILLNKHDVTYENWPVNAYFYFGLENQENKEYEQAIECYDEVIKIDSKNTGAYNNRGNAKSALERYKEAILDYDEAINLDPDNVDAYHNRGITKGILGYHKGAIADYDKVINLAPDSVRTYHNRGTAKSELGHYKEAMADYDEAIKIDPEYAEAYYNRGTVKSTLGRYKEAILDYDEAIKIDPEYAEAYHNRGTTKGKLGRNEEAIADYDKAIDLAPEYAEAYNSRGVVKSILGRNEEAILDYDKAIDLAPEYAEAYNNRGIAKGKLGRNEEATADFDKVIDFSPEYAGAYYNRGNTKSILGRYKEAIADYDKAIRFDPKNVGAYYNRCLCKILVDDMAGALMDYREAKRLASNDMEIVMPKKLKEYLDSEEDE